MDAVKRPTFPLSAIQAGVYVAVGKSETFEHSRYLARRISGVKRWFEDATERGVIVNVEGFRVYIEVEYSAFVAAWHSARQLDREGGNS